MKIQIPDKWLGEPIEGSMKRVLSAQETEEIEQPLKTEQPQPTQGFIYVPSLKIQIAKQHYCLGKNWYQSHEELQNQGLSMLTLPEFIEFRKYLEANPTQENQAIFEEIFACRSPWRAEHLDAFFVKKGREIYINYNHKIVTGKLTPQNIEPLEKCLMKDRNIDLNSFNKQGLPTRKGTDFFYYSPRENYVARFGANSDGADLYCGRSPGDSSSSLGVFACAESTPKNFSEVKS
ncbi:hypothetical protein HYV50_05805 [Candidatus Pacearchaeota archaeon]|nr:hypothetical protein [Candidatus Pacearchaeota archaeon]